MLGHACTAPRAVAGRRHVGAPAGTLLLQASAGPPASTALCSPGCRCGRHGLRRLLQPQLQPPATAARRRAVRAASDPRDAGAGYGQLDVPDEWQDEWMSGTREGGGGVGRGASGSAAAGAGAGASRSALRFAEGDQVPEAWTDEWQSGNPAIEERDPTTPTSGGGGSGGSRSGSVAADTEQEIPDANVPGLDAEDFGGSGAGASSGSGSGASSGSVPTAAQGTAAESSGVDLGRLGGGSLAGGLGAREAGPMAASRQAAAGTQQPQQQQQGGGEREDEDEPYSSHRRRGNWMT